MIKEGKSILDLAGFPNGNRRCNLERFWMGGIHAQDLAEIRSDLTALDEPGFWAISGSFEGRWTLARFNETRRENFSSSGDGF